MVEHFHCRIFQDFEYTSYICMCIKSLQSWLTLCDPVDCSPAGSSVHGILQARILERVSMPSSRGSSHRDRTQVSYVSCISWVFVFFFYHQCHLSKLISCKILFCNLLSSLRISKHCQQCSSKYFVLFYCFLQNEDLLFF